MNDASQKPRRRRRGRLAAATAAALGATLLAYPGGTATAQTVDCSALGEDPVQGGLKSALSAAHECGVEVRIENRTWPYSTVYATPQGTLHLVSTAAPAQQWENSGHLDPALEEWEGSLTQVRTERTFLLQHTDPDVPLIESHANAVLDWTGATPVPSYTESTAVYDELATGLDLTVDVGIDSADLRFTAADADAWNALTTGLSVGDSPLVSAGNGSLFLSDDDPYILTGPQRTTPFIVRDAQGATTPVDLTVGAGGALAIGVPDGALDNAAYPLTLSTQWAHGANVINEWGSTTSATPDLAVFRGQGGFDERYFEAAGQTGDALVGDYCDATFTSACKDAESASYWNFQWPLLDRFRHADGFTLSFPVESATFTVDAADPNACVAPAVRLTEPYGPVSTWAASPAAIDGPATGACASGIAAYDVAPFVADTWGDGTAYSGPVTLGMTGGETARFDGDSARLDVHFDIRGYQIGSLSSESCGPNASNVDYTSDTTPEHGGFTVYTWLPEVLGTEITWTATFNDVDDGGRTVLTTGPHTAAEGANAKVSVPAASPLPDSQYEVGYDLYADGRWVRNVTCGLVVDTEDPEVLDIEVAPGPHHIGDTVAVDLALADEHFPDGWNTLTVGCVGGSQCENPQQVEVSDVGTVRFEVRLPKAVNKPRFYIHDRAGNEIYSDTVVIPASNDLNDYNGDGRQDLFAVRKSDGNLMFSAGLGDGTFKTAVSLGAGWGKMDIAMVGDVTGDGHPDLFARDTATGTAYTYKGNGAGSVGSRVVAGTGWQDIGAFGAGGELFASTGLDVLAVDRSDGNLYYYPFAGDGSGKFVDRILAGSGGWNAMDNLTGIGDSDNDGFGDFLAHDGRTGQYFVYHYLEPDGQIAYGRRTALGASLGESPGRRYDRVVNGGDLNGDGYNDLVGADSRTGELVSFSYGEKAAIVRPGTVAGTGWGGSRLPAATLDGTYDYNGDGTTDFVARNDSDGTSYLYPGTGTGGHGTRVSWGTALKDMTLIATAGDMNGDGFADVLARTSGGTLYLYPGAASGALNTAGRITVGSDWNGMGTIIGGHDHNSDGKTDVIAVGSDGTLWLYPGTGDGRLGARKSIGSSWTSMKEPTAAGDLDHDGHADMVAVRISDGCLYFYGGKGDGTFKPMVNVGCGWNAMDSITGVGDFNRDGHVDWMARRKSDGSLFLYPGNGVGNHTSSKLVGTGWNAMTIA
jgi:hypothetical protein